MNKKILVVVVVAAVAVAVGVVQLLSNIQRSGGGQWEPWKNYPELGSGPVTFTYSPISLDKVTDITPLGHLNPPAHPIPTDHLYVGITGDAEVRAPADGIITELTHFEDEGTYSITITHTNTMKSWLEFSSISDWILENANGFEIGLHIPVKAGEVVGEASGSDSAPGIDWGVYDRDITLNFIHPEKYAPYTDHTVCPLDYLTPELKSLADNKTYFRTYLAYGETQVAQPKCGKIDYDQPGKLIGNWFLEGLTSLLEENAWEKVISFVYEMGYPSQIRIGIGGTLSISEITNYAVEGNSPDPAEVTVESGPVIYRLRGTPEFGTESLTATILVQMLDNGRIKVEGFDWHPSNPTFTPNAKYYTR